MTVLAVIGREQLTDGRGLQGGAARTARRTYDWVRPLAREPVLFAALIVINAVPAWVFKYFPSQDGPAHLATAELASELHAHHSGVLAQYYVASDRLVPNWLVPMGLRGLVALVSPPVAQKVVVTGYLVLLPVAIRYAVTALRRDAVFLGYLAFPLTYSYFLHMGLYDFVYGLALYFVVVGYWLRHGPALGIGRAVVLAALVLLLYFAHLVAFVAGAASLAGMLVWRACLRVARDRRVRPAGGRRRTFRDSGRAIWPAAFAMAGPAILALVFVRHQGHVGGFALRADWGDILHKLVTLDLLVSFHPLEGQLAELASALFAALVLYTLVVRARQRTLDPFDGFLVLALMWVGVALVTPAHLAGGSLVTDRLLVFPLASTLLWLAGHRYSRPIQVGAAVAAALVAIAFAVLHVARYRELDAYAAEYARGAPAILAGARVLPILVSDTAAHTTRLTRRIHTLWNFGTYVTTSRRSVDVSNYQATTGYFPIEYRPGHDAFRRKGPCGVGLAGGRFIWTSRVRLALTDHCVDYVLVGDVGNDRRATATFSPLLQAIRTRFALVYRSRPRGVVRVYRRR
ncbi:MAG: hypothetical protein JOZ25_07095 [Actinobacteria bacterium]|nr:hypothetical protein [Actinomycetota bacterium]